MADDKILKNVILIYDDGAVQTKKPRETLAEARARLEDPENPYNANNGTECPLTEDVEALLIPKMNELGSYIDVAYSILRQRGLSNDKAWALINDLMNGEVFD